MCLQTDEDTINVMAHWKISSNSNNVHLFFSFWARWKYILPVDFWSLSRCNF